MPSPHSLRRLADLTKQVRNDLRRGGMAVNFKYVFRSTSILARITEVLADQVASQAEHQAELEQALADTRAQLQAALAVIATEPLPGPAKPRRQAETVDG